MKKKIFLFALFDLFLLAVAASAQSTSPIIVEVYAKPDKPIHGSFTVTNSAVRKMAVTFQAVSFQLDKNGNASYRQLDPGISVTMSSSTELAAKESKQIDYEVRTNHYPIALKIYSAFLSGRQETGIGLRYVLPHVLYACDKNSKEQKNKRGCRAYIHELWGVPAGK